MTSRYLLCEFPLSILNKKAEHFALAVPAGTTIIRTPALVENITDRQQQGRSYVYEEMIFSYVIDLCVRIFWLFSLCCCYPVVIIQYKGEYRGAIKKTGKTTQSLFRGVPSPRTAYSLNHRRGS